MSEKSKSSALPWCITVVLLIACVVAFLNPRKELVVREVEKKIPVEVYRTNEVIKEVEKRVEVPRIIEVPAEIPAIYVNGSNFLVNYVNALYSSNVSSPLHGLTNVMPKVFLDKRIAGQISEDEVKTRFELTLRKYGIPLGHDASRLLALEVDGIGNDATQAFSYDIRNDPNDWAQEHNDPKYILNLLKRVITVSLETMKIVNALPMLNERKDGIFVQKMGLD